MLSSDNVGESAWSIDGHADESDHSIDTIIGWLRERRNEQPEAPLGVLLADKRLTQDCLVDVACIDLIGIRRAGQSIRVEDYLRDFPQLADPRLQLDLIDAEICVDRELGHDVSLEKLVERFPELKSEIAELLKMDPLAQGDLILIAESSRSDPSADPSTGQDRPAGQLTPSIAAADGDSSLEFSVSQPLTDQKTAIGSEHPIDVPEWFLGERCVASGPGHWLVRGREATRGETLAMKVVELPLQVTHRQVEQLMDACEKAAKVRNPTWLLPAVAAVQERHLAVIRSWVFANPWQHGSRVTDHAKRLRQLSMVAYALQSAHSAGAAHGGIHLTNLLVDHDGKVQVVDGCASRSILNRWFDGDDFASISQRQRWDIQDLVKLIVNDAFDWSGEWVDALVREIRRQIDLDPSEACGRIGDVLIRCADGDRRSVPPSTANATAVVTGFRGRLAAWMSRRTP